MEQQQSREHVDPVCHMVVDEKTAAGKSTHAGRDYYFCSVSCKERFDQSPQEFLAGLPPA